VSQCRFCAVPFGTWGGYGGRYVAATLFGCVPVFLHPPAQSGARSSPLSPPFEELPGVDWEACSLRASVDEVDALAETLEAVPDAKVRGSRLELGLGSGLRLGGQELAVVGRGRGEAARHLGSRFHAANTQFSKPSIFNPPDPALHP